MIHVKDRFCIAAGTESWNGAEIQLWSGRDDEMIVRNLARHSDEAILLWLDPIGCFMDELDAFFPQHLNQREADVLPFSPSPLHLRIRRDEVKRLDIKDRHHLMFPRKQLPRLIGGG